MPWVGPLHKDLALIWVFKNHLFRWKIVDN
jgi:hypothetical protein